MAGKKETAFVLESAPTSAPQKIGGVPGLWTVGEPRLASEFEPMTASEVEELLDSTGFPFKKTSAEKQEPAEEPEGPQEPADEPEGGE